MIIQGVGGHRNLKTHEKIHDDQHSNIGPSEHNSGQAHILTVEGIEYFMKRPDGPLCGDNFFNGINNQTINVDGEFVAGIIIVSSWSKA